MRKFLKLFGRSEKPKEQGVSEAGAEQCPHRVLAPRWDSVQDMGREDRVVGYRCTACGSTLTFEEARHRRSITL